jgi:uncharacterized protein
MTQQQPVRVVKLNADGRAVFSYDGVIVERGATWVYLRADFQPERVDLGFVVFRRGDVFHEWFYTDRWYNVFRIEDGQSGELKGWYCNITRPAKITPHTVHADDLALDMYVMPDGTVHLLDVDEFEVLALSPAEREAALSAAATLRQQVAERQPPFSDIAP